MNQRGVLARTLGRSIDRPLPKLKPLTWTENRFPLPEQPGLMETVLLTVHRQGVYIIEKMTERRSTYTVRVGSVTTGTIYSRLRDHSANCEITHHMENNPWFGLRAFWTWTGPLNPEGVEKYLAAVLDPKVGRYPKEVEAVEVVLPEPIRERILGIVRRPLALADLGPYPVIR